MAKKFRIIRSNNVYCRNRHRYISHVVFHLACKQNNFISTDNKRDVNLTINLKYFTLVKETILCYSDIMVFCGVIMKFIKNHILVTTIKGVGANPRMSILTEPLWYIPFALFTPFQSIYMRQIGLSSEQIGFTIAFGLLLQVFGGPLGGVLADKMGRRKSTFITDIISWSFPCLIWAFAQDFWWFLIAASINACASITHVTWACLFIEDCPPKLVRNAFLIIQVAGMLSVFFSPISIWLVAEHGVVPVVRVLYIISAISMTVKFILLYRYGKETQLGLKRMEETKDTGYLKLLAGYKDVFIIVLRSKKMMFVVAFITIMNISLIPINSFFSIYVTETLLLPSELIALFPMIRTVIMLVFVLQLQSIIQRLNMRQGAIIGLLLYIASHIMLLTSPPQSMIGIVVYTLMEAVAFSFVAPRKDELMVLYVDEKNRSRIFSIYLTVMVAISAPFGMIFGWLYELNSQIPFFVNIGLFIIAMILIVTSKDIKNHEQHIGE